VKAKVGKQQEEEEENGGKIARKWETIITMTR
jgi:hypothetical protein